MSLYAVSASAQSDRLENGLPNTSPESLERQLAHSQRLATLGQLAASTLHELTQPLSGLVNYLQACRIDARQASSDSESLLANLQSAARQADRMVEIIRRCRKYASLNKSEFTSASLPEIVQNAVGLVEWRARELSIAVCQRLDSDLLSLRCDPIAIEQCLVNLLTNAVDATAECPPPRPAVVVETSRSGDSIAIRIIDEGPGLGQCDIDRLFTAFASSKPDGLGLGLVVVQQTIQAHGGTVRAWRNEHLGMTFEMQLPLFPERVA